MNITIYKKVEQNAKWNSGVCVCVRESGVVCVCSWMDICEEYLCVMHITGVR